MLFTNTRSVPIQKKTPNTIQFNVARQIQRTQMIQPSIPVAHEVLPDNASKKKMKWGEPTWFLFHTLAQKIREESFQQIRTELLDIIYTICNNLPCPDCAKHATAYMNGINFNTIQTKEQLKELIFQFHNEVNKRKNIPLFNRADLDIKYNAANLVPIIQNFMRHFRDKHASIHMIASDLHRNRLSVKISAWFQTNLGHFEL